MPTSAPTPSGQPSGETAGRTPERPPLVIFVVHGSRNPRWQAAVEELTALLQSDLGQDQVRLAYMECASPTLADAACDAIRSGGARRIRVLPLFLTSEGHVDHTIRPQVDELRKMLGPSVEVELLPPVGQHRLFLETLHAIAVEALK